MADNLAVTGRKSDKLFRDALMLSVNEVDKTTGFRKLRQIADSARDKAIEGDVSAITLVRDTLDGKPAVYVETHQTTLITADNEVQELARRLLYLTARAGDNARLIEAQVIENDAVEALGPQE